MSQAEYEAVAVLCGLAWYALATRWVPKFPGHEYVSRTRVATGWLLSPAVLVAAPIILWLAVILEGPEVGIVFVVMCLVVGCIATKVGPAFWIVSVVVICVAGLVYVSGPTEA